jgi:hypothetical protein
VKIIEIPVSPLHQQDNMKSQFTCKTAHKKNEQREEEENKTFSAYFFN